MSKKITQEEFLARFYRSYPESKIKLIEYTAISNPAVIQCEICGRRFKNDRARYFLSHYSCCGSKNLRQIDRLESFYKDCADFDFIKQTDKDHYIVRHRVCGQEFERTITAGMDNPLSCRYCDTKKINNLLPIQEVQKAIDEKFGGDIQILDYNGQLKRNHYKCLKCGLIFTQQQTCLMQSRGCPKCDKWKSKGEKFIAQLLAEHKLDFKEQVPVKGLPLQHFDFGVYFQGKLLYYIEVQGEQHFEVRECFRDSLEKIQERDARKRCYCLEHNIPLYELIYKKGKFINLDILPF